MSVNLFLLIQTRRGSPPPPPLFLNPVQPIFRLPTTQASDESLKMNSAVSDDPSQKNSADEDSIAALQDAIASTQRAIASARDKHVRQALLDSAESLAKHLSDARLSSRSGDSSSAKPKPMQTATNRQETIRRTVTLGQSSTLLSLAHRSNDLTNRQIVTQTIHLAGKVVPHPARGVGILAIRRKRTIRIRIANNGTNNKTKRIISALPH